VYTYIDSKERKMLEMILPLVGLTLAGASVISNDAVQTLGTFMVSNKKTEWWKLWLPAAAILITTILYSWINYNGDISYGRLENIPYVTVQWYHALAPGVLLLLTRLGIPVSTTFLVLSAFASSVVFEKMLLKSMLGYAISAVFAYALWMGLSKLLDEKKKVKKNHERYWRVAQWCSTGFLWFTWLSHDLANIAVFAPRQMSGMYVSGVIVLLVSFLAFMFWERGGKIQEIVTNKSTTAYVRSATIIDGVYAFILLYLKEMNNIPMSTTWVFVGLLCGRELAIATSSGRKVKKVFPMVVKDFLKMLLGLAVSVLIILLVHKL
jgi:phosphate/sulfate permease